MHFSSSEEINAPRDHVFAEITDFAGFERQIERAGGDVTRTGDPGPDAAWTGRFSFRGTQRDVKAQVTDWAVPGGYRIISDTGGLSAVIDVRCVSIDAERTRLDVLLDLKPTTLGSRVLINSFKLMRMQLNRRFNRRVRDFALGVAHRARRET
jgi:carbon monoxide dehydrogenase subunit G